MRGVEAALLVLRDVGKGELASIALRKYAPELPQTDMTLAASLVYCTLRKRLLWYEMLRSFLKPDIEGLNEETVNAMLLGAAGMTELRHFAPMALANALVQRVKDNVGEREARVVNAVLHRVGESGREYIRTLAASSDLKDCAILNGVPPWAAFMLKEGVGQQEARKLVRMARIRPYASFRVWPEAKAQAVLAKANASGCRCWMSPLLPYSVRLSSSVYPPSFAGYNEGASTPQGESSMMVGEVVRRLWKKGAILDMCSGRGIKAGQIASLLPNAGLECWELSAGRVRVLEKERSRLQVSWTIQTGDALSLQPRVRPDLILLDAPCSNSGTWTRHPEGKQRLSVDNVVRVSDLQSQLLRRALSLVAPGGVVVYATCSLFRKENEEVIARVLAERSDLFEIPPPLSGVRIHRGRPWGVYLWPELPWLDGFYIAVLGRKNQEGTA